MKLHITFLLLFGLVLSTLAQDRKLSADTSVVTTNEVTVKGKRFPYTATTGMQPVWDKDGKVIASLYYTYYERSDIKDRASRPLMISFNGGPGSSSAWMHLGYTGPRVLLIDPEGYPVQPYGFKENPNTVLDVADIVYVNPVNVGYSRILDEKTPRETFFGVNADIKYLAGWISTFVTRKGRWQSPKYLIGESYGTTRVSGLALELQDQQWLYLNGVILVSPTGLGIDRSGPVDAANRLPYFAAAAWYHKVLPADLQKKDLTEVLAEVEPYTTNELLPVIAMGGFADPQKKKEAAAKMARYSGLSETFILQNNLNVSTQAFWKELLRDKGFIIGRLDSRYLGIDRMDAGEFPDYNPESSSWSHAFAPAINYYIREQLKFKTDVKYNVYGPVSPWDRSNDHSGENLRQAMAQNPYLKVMIQSGYFDGATTYFNAKYSMWNLDPSGKMKDRLSWKGYRSGHMMYLRAEDSITANDDVRDFINNSLSKGKPAKY
ncbi:MAG: carboxypeptidase [Flammeovirgaceae bacterium]|nr:carboxypeptidase [Flammeovirgaceae bacterium]